MPIERKRVAPGSSYVSTAVAIHQARYLLASSYTAGRSVLDIACGEGLGSAQLASCWGAREVIGVDVSEEAILSAKTNFRGIDNLDFYCDDALEYLHRCDRMFDVIVSIETLEHLEKPEQFLQLIRSRLAPGGCVVLTVPNDELYFGPGRTLNSFHRKTFSFEEFRTMTERFFGKGHYFGGIALNGFGAFPIDQLEKVNMYSPKVIDEDLCGRMVVGSLVGANQTSRFRKDSAVFYAGVFPFRKNKVRPSVGVITSSSDFTDQVPGLWNKLQHTKGSSPLPNITFVVESVKAGQDIVDHLDGFVSEKLRIGFYALREARSGGASEHTSHLHFTTTGLASLFLQELRARDVSGGGSAAVKVVRSARRQCWSVHISGSEKFDTAFWKNDESIFFELMSLDKSSPVRDRLREYGVSLKSVTHGVFAGQVVGSALMDVRDILSILVAGNRASAPALHKMRTSMLLDS
ncbi:class I SAM-dependent methyltransferase [Pararhizobium mangrovi]|uniref:Class I SAM-dependent methyltransferase n=1 Tax=Pararhizobium mangrovi TaxID=2590452 RepID=A0A506UDY3_9HYPH|nr:class I SAM-dependent methyltransferase [Pararhizobium mangrovi]TPW32652.1 class I SAM-dependent methyltransferase [Pararhizobium mangrovi]